MNVYKYTCMYRACTYNFSIIVIRVLNIKEPLHIQVQSPHVQVNRYIFYYQYFLIFYHLPSIYVRYFIQLIHNKVWIQCMYVDHISNIFKTNENMYTCTFNTIFASPTVIAVTLVGSWIIDACSIVLTGKR